MNSIQSCQGNDLAPLSTDHLWPCLWPSRGWHLCAQKPLWRGYCHCSFLHGGGLARNSLRNLDFQFPGRQFTAEVVLGLCGVMWAQRLALGMGR
jgi:hypothetical protein